jgi:hypothetical protein
VRSLQKFHFIILQEVFEDTFLGSLVFNNFALAIIMAAKIRETDLYAPIKLLLEGQGYEVKGEIGSADVVGVRGDEEPVIVELKTGFSLSLFHQGIDRQSLSDNVYVAVPQLKTKAFRGSLKANKSLCRRLGLGLISVRLKDGHSEIHIDPAPYRPRKSKPKQARMLREFARLVGDPNMGGATRQGLITAYRQDALRCIRILTQSGPLKAAEVSKLSQVEHARRLMADNHYGWFERVKTGIYGLSPKGCEAVNDYADEIERIN